MLKRSFVEVVADVKTFELMGENIGKDDKHVFYKDKILQELDAATCSYEKESKILRDKNCVFIFNTMKAVSLYEVEGADPETFFVLGNSYVKDKNQVYMEGHLLNRI